MKTIYNKEDLLHSLPDYVSKQINNRILSDEIEKEIEINPEFRAEYDDMKRTFNFLDSAELETPNENYFNNLSVRINDRVINDYKKSVWEKFGLFWKIFIPAVSIIIIAILLYNNLKDDSTEAKITENSNKKIEIIEQNKATENKTDLTQKENFIIPGKQVTKSQIINKSNLLNKKLGSTQRRVYESPVESPLQNVKVEGDINEYPVLTNSLAEIVEENTGNDSEHDVLYIIDAEDDEVENEFLDLTPEEQHEVLENLSKSQI